MEITNFAPIARCVMRKTAIFCIMSFLICMVLPSCEKEVYDINPQMEAYYQESVQLPSVTIDSVRSFSSKVDGFTRSYPWAVEHERYPQIKENIREASARITIDIDTTWAGTNTYYY